MFYGQKRQFYLLWPVRGDGLDILPATGQNQYFDNNGRRVPCGGSGQDGELCMGRSWPKPRFEIAGDAIEDRLRTQQDLRKPLTAKLATSMNVPPDTEFPWPPAVPVMILCPTEDELFEALPEHSPQIKRLEYLEARDKADMELARKQFYPDVTFGIENIVTGLALMPNTPDSGKDAVIASVTVNIPFWWERRKAAVREGRAKITATSKGTEALKRSLLSDMELALYKYRDAQRKIDLYLNTLIPKAEEALGVTLEAFQTGTLSSLDLIDAEKTLLEFQLSYIRALTDQAQRLAELEWILGQEIPCEIHGAILPGKGTGPRH
jgi:outer membrane protein, heavy metal efflux system